MKISNLFHITAAATCPILLVGYDGAFIIGKEDLYRAYQPAPKAKVVGSHMESIAHCTQSRKDLHDYIAEKGMNPQRVLIPQDRESYRF